MAIFQMGEMVQRGATTLYKLPQTDDRRFSSKNLAKNRVNHCVQLKMDSVFIEYLWAFTVQLQPNC